MIDFILSNTDKLIAIAYLIVFSVITIFNVSLHQQNWIRTFSGSMTLVLLPIVTYSITSVISGNIALSLGMIGALSIVRFRNPVRSSFELAIFFFMISLGICAAVDLRWVVVLGASVNAIIFTMKNFNKLKNDHLEFDDHPLANIKDLMDPDKPAPWDHLDNSPGDGDVDVDINKEEEK